MKRTFIAINIEPGKQLLKVAGHLQKKLSNEKISWVAPQNLHLTLHFLGETPDDKLPVVKTILQQLASSAQPFTFQLEGVSCFKRHGQPSVIFLAIPENGQLTALASKLGLLLGEAGFMIDERPFKPHLTLARVKYLNNKIRFYKLLEQLDQSNQPVSQVVEVKEIIFFESVLKSSGPQYVALQKFTLG
ncbi:RNA 2',3'-cyclic phosphodiesterase [Gaoshiqia sediminis]|uniref:RNA 2',3'-cyclic phosphodiesterase n=1 Tax=Gaoshiqia sediminis TaxID=2986998 RepID=A0AA41YAM4_9BACT|nr:RNA 2',3'-cyclic phosphodiesterase [Gaoshiqia sediminis]MCW0484781.1 RNA 2',3'-cyclic phosphodiesterase [Gaoshiqia sediminis]